MGKIIETSFSQKYASNAKSTNLAPINDLSYCSPLYPMSQIGASEHFNQIEIDFCPQDKHFVIQRQTI